MIDINKRLIKSRKAREEHGDLIKFFALSLRLNLYCILITYGHVCCAWIPRCTWLCLRLLQITPA